jgi:hypothetical protein
MLITKAAKKADISKAELLRRLILDHLVEIGLISQKEAYDERGPEKGDSE